MPWRSGVDPLAGTVGERSVDVDRHCLLRDERRFRRPPAKRSARACVSPSLTGRGRSCGRRANLPHVRFDGAEARHAKPLGPAVPEPRGPGYRSWLERLPVGRQHLSGCLALIPAKTTSSPDAWSPSRPIRLPLLGAGHSGHGCPSRRNRTHRPGAGDVVRWLATPVVPPSPVGFADRRSCRPP